MADTKVLINPNEVNKIIKDYAEQRKKAENLTVEFSGVTDLDVLFLLKIMSKKEQGVDDIAAAAEVMLDGRTITFKNGEEQIFAASYNKGNGNALHLMFVDKPYLYDILQQAVYAMMLKKLTPHLEGSN